MSLRILKLFVLFILFFLNSCANQVASTDCKNNNDCAPSYYCRLTTGKCQKEDKEKTGDIGQKCNIDKTCNYAYLFCSKNNTCDVIQDSKEKQCHPNDRANCYTGVLETLGKGVCKPGYYLCNGDSKWDTTCSKEVLPKEEICNNGLDDNCNGKIDENCDIENYCTAFSKKSCYTADEITQNIGICKSGYKICNENNEWNNSCINEITPQTEICNNGLDDNCNGKIDENCDCINGEKQSCFSGNFSQQGVGICKAGIQTCINGSWSDCQGEVKPSSELCNGKDDNCNGIIDDGVSNLCNGACEPEITELCDGIDNNCNGKTDENCSRTCLNYEVCGNFIDDNCNNEIDENCYDKPQCVAQEIEICSDILDNDCNLFINDNCSCESGSSSECYSGPSETIEAGECKKGIMYCIGGESWGACNGEITPIPELCNGKDDNCNGKIDEHFHVSEKCYVGLGQCKKEGVFVCDANSEGVICVNPQTAQEIQEDNSLASQELCDGIDNDCDGLIDEGFLVNKPCVVGYANCQAEGKTVCSDDKKSVVCDAQANSNNAKEEICNNGIDDDCDGLIDEATGSELCDDNVDNNCNGLIDEQPCLTSGPSVTCPMLSQVYQNGEDKIYTLQDYVFTATATDPNNDELSYKWELISAPEGNGQIPNPTNSLTTNFTPYLVSNRMNENPKPYILKFTATEKNTEAHLSDSCEISFYAVTKDVFHVELVWDSISDMDLHLVTPNGNSTSFIPRDNNGIDCNYASCRGPVGLEWNGTNNLDNPYLDLDNTVGFGCANNNNLECNRPENINVPSPRANVGDYYRVAVYAYEGIGSNLKLKILCKAQTEGEFVVKEYYKSSLKSTSTEFNRWWKPANINWHGSYCTIEDN